MKNDYKFDEIPDIGQVVVGDMIQFDKDSNYYVILAITNDGIVVKKLDFEKIAEDVINANHELLEKLDDER